MISPSLISEAYAHVPVAIFVQFSNQVSLSNRTYISLLTLTLFFPMFPFDPPENIRKPLSFLTRVHIRGKKCSWFSDVFREIKREHWEEKG